MVRTIKKKCFYCGKLFWKLPRHTEICKARKEQKKDQRKPRKSFAEIENKLRMQIEDLTRKNAELEQTLANVRASMDCSCNKTHDPQMTLKEAVDNALVKDATRRDYATTTKQYSEFCSKASIDEFNARSITRFLNDLYQTHRVETVKKRRRHLNSLLKIARPNQHFSIQPINTSESKIKKYVLSNEELKSLIEEAEERERKDLGVLMELLHSFSLRINSACLLKGGSLNDGKLAIFDQKNSVDMVVELSKKMNKDLKDLIKSNRDPDSFIFFPKSKTANRIGNCTRELNDYLKSSKLCPDNGQKFTSHMFRITKANQIYRAENEKAIKKVQEELMHKSSTSTKHYIYDQSAKTKLSLLI